MPDKIVSSNHHCLHVAGNFFSDIIDGYFSLHDSLLQMMIRQDFHGAWISIAHIPFINPSVSSAYPLLPVKLASQYNYGYINRMELAVAVEGERLKIKGVSNWTYLHKNENKREYFLPSFRLAEPAFIHGIGI